MSKNIYYTAPSDEIFNELKKIATEIYTSVEGKEYALEKIGGIENIKDNFMYILLGMDTQNIQKAFKKCSKKCQQSILKRLEAVEAPEYDLLLKQ